MASLKEVLAAQIPKKQEEMKKLKKDYGHLSLGEVTVDQAIGGGRDVKCMYYETSLLDAQEVEVISTSICIHTTLKYIWSLGYSFQRIQYS